MKRLKKAGRALPALAFWLIVWQLLSLLVGKELLLPAPLAVLRRLAALASASDYWRAVGLSLLRIACGVLCGAASGVLLAVLTARSRAAGALLRPLLTAVKATPVASFIILALLWMGRNILPGFIAALIVLPVVWTNVETGIRETPPDLLEVAQVFRFSGRKLLTKLYAPSVLPYFLSACRSALGLGWKAGIAAEVLTVPAISIGKQLYEAKLYWETPDLFAWTLTVILCSLVIETLVTAALDRLCARYRREAAHD